jgi:hypothetical protein
VRARPLATLIVLAAALPGCGSDEGGLDYDLRTPPPYVGAVPVAPPGQKAVDRKMTRGDADRYKPVIADWAQAVRDGDAATAAAFFDLPAVVYQPGPGRTPLQLNTPATAEAFNAAFPCGAKLLGTNPDGRYVVATFVLVKNREATPCNGEGNLARVGFVFGDKRHPRQFTEWWQVPDAPESKTGPAKRPTAVAPATVSDFG